MEASTDAVCDLEQQRNVNCVDPTRNSVALINGSTVESVMTRQMKAWGSFVYAPKSNKHP
jgi:hypothetical protein